MLLNILQINFIPVFAAMQYFFSFLKPWYSGLLYSGFASGMDS